MASKLSSTHGVRIAPLSCDKGTSGQIDESRWDEKAGLRRDAIRSQVIGALEAQEIKETGNEKD
jgi:hypothetical protein